jgi:hypothetical protein
MKTPGLKVDQLKVRIFYNRQKAGMAAAIKAAQTLRTILGKQASARIITASAPSQNEVLAGLAQARLEAGDHISS